MSEDTAISSVHTRCWEREREKKSQQGPFPIAQWTGNAEQWGHTLGISALQLCCPVLLHSCECLSALVENAKGVLQAYQLSLLPFVLTCPPGLNRHREIWQQGSFMSNNGNKEAQSLMVMRLYFRAAAASLQIGELFGTGVRQKCALIVPPKTSEEILWLASTLYLIIWTNHVLSTFPTDLRDSSSVCGDPCEPTAI